MQKNLHMACTSLQFLYMMLLIALTLLIHSPYDQNYGTWKISHGKPSPYQLARWIQLFSNLEVSSFSTTRDVVHDLSAIIELELCWKLHSHNIIEEQWKFAFYLFCVLQHRFILYWAIIGRCLLLIADPFWNIMDLYDFLI